MAGRIRVGALLAGGRGTRLRRGDKGLVGVGGQPMISRVHACLVPQVDHIVINANSDPARFQFLDAPVIPDSFADAGGAGPLAGVHAVLTWVNYHASPSASVVTVPVDAPFLPDDLVARLEEACRPADVDISVASSGGRRHPVIACWPVTLLGELEGALTDGVRKIDAFTSTYRVSVVEWQLGAIDPFFNVNTAEDLSRANRALANPLLHEDGMSIRYRRSDSRMPRHGRE